MCDSQVMGPPAAWYGCANAHCTLPGVSPAVTWGVLDHELEVVVVDEGKVSHAREGDQRERDNAGRHDEAPHAP
jgi:hypothetical protein